MKISKRSWHYRLVDFAFKKPSTSLCIYFWQIPLAALMILVVTSVTIIIGATLGAAILLALSIPVLINLSPQDLSSIMAMGLISTVVWAAALKEFYDRCYRKPWNKVLWNTKNKKEPVDKKPSLIWEYLKAKKDKICPTIEFEWR